ncbi:hypothetical protein AAVH_28706 [Aphelenchoides avenae]|nr:hypothetical protein AAVH_28706 [Aphelenchus avenae]
MTGVGIVFEAAPALKYADEVGLNSQEGSAVGKDSDAFMHNFTGLKTLRLQLDFDVFRLFSWNFLHKACSRGFRLIKACIPDVRADVPGKREKLNRCVDEIVLDCLAQPFLPGGDLLELDFSENGCSAAFGLSIIEVSK